MQKTDSRNTERLVKKAPSYGSDFAKVNFGVAKTGISVFTAIVVAHFAAPGIKDVRAEMKQAFYSCAGTNDSQQELKCWRGDVYDYLTKHSPSRHRL